MKTLEENKRTALENYKAAKKKYLENMDFKNPNDENWKAFCEAKRTCILLGVRI